MKAAKPAFCVCACAVLLPGLGFAAAPATSPVLPVLVGERLAGPGPVRLGESVEGRKVIFNESVAQRARRFSGHLVPFPDAALELMIARHSGAQSLDPRLVRAVIQVESGYNQRARSNKGAIGLMQLMPETAVELAVRDPYDPDENLRGGTTYLRRLLDLFSGRLELALAAYNAGPGAVDRHRGVPPYPDTIDYVRRVLDLYQDTPGAALAAVQARAGRRPAPYVTRAGNGRIVVTTALSGLK
ncbi:MAG TPA: lytic transglycosylase domain-containing protein [Thermoanaerobaculia bacterium]|nr:lytic transglycosylase domain-containing protein [Thermoanaerobaculia bacterium]